MIVMVKHSSSLRPYHQGNDANERARLHGATPFFVDSHGFPSALVVRASGFYQDQSKSTQV